MSIGSFSSRLLDTLATLAVIGAALIVISRTGINWSRDSTVMSEQDAPALGGATQFAAAMQGPATLPVRATDIIGSREASVAIVEYVDFECSFCAAFAEDTLPHIRKQYVAPGKVMLVTKQFPLPRHRHARNAAIAAVCASQQGRGDEMRYELFRREGEFSESTPTALASALGLHAQSFDDCALIAGAAIDADVAAARALGISGTPSFVLGYVDDQVVRVARVLVGALPIEVFRQALDDLLAQAPTPGNGR
jgi:protein-disulfide isomerase